MFDVGDKKIFFVKNTYPHQSVLHYIISRRRRRRRRRLCQVFFNVFLGVFEKWFFGLSTVCTRHCARSTELCKDSLRPLAMASPPRRNFSTKFGIYIVMIFESFLTFLSKVLFFSGMVNEKSSFPKPLSKEEEEQYLVKFHAGDMMAKDVLIRHNLRLVAHVVKKYNGAAEADDLISCGTIGLIKAINSFKTERGTRISTYAARCIENEILMYLRVTKKHQQVHSLNECLGSDKDGNDIVLFDIVADESEPLTDRAEHRIMMKKLVAQMQQRLSDREYKIIALRYGIENNIALPQREVAKKLGISRSYISRIEKHAIETVKDIVAEKSFSGFHV